MAKSKCRGRACPPEADPFPGQSASGGFPIFIATQDDKGGLENSSAYG
ncbi:MAG: hypothetical protein QMD05_02665 [Candidatus Brocadiaceae bacterium]|nr:hypothetical protein [Candidatus Brocadiaceae bacterium]